MNHSLIIRQASRSDLRDVLRLHAQPDLYNGEVLSVSEAEIIFGRMARYPNYHVYVVIKDAGVVGTFALLIMDNLGHRGACSAVIEDVAVDPAFHSQGIGRQMIRHAIQLAGDHGCYKAVLSSNLKRERAHAFYESLDFERHGYSFLIHPQHQDPVDRAVKS